MSLRFLLPFLDRLVSRGTNTEVGADLKTHRNKIPIYCVAAAIASLLRLYAETSRASCSRVSRVRSHQNNQPSHKPAQLLRCLDLLRSNSDGESVR